MVSIIATVWAVLKDMPEPLIFATSLYAFGGGTLAWAGVCALSRNSGRWRIEREEKRLVGTWSVTENGAQLTWHFYQDGSVIAKTTAGTVEGRWQLGERVTVIWDTLIPPETACRPPITEAYETAHRMHSWNTLNRPIKPKGTRGNSWTWNGKDGVYAIKQFHTLPPKGPN
jgi:hypothetical protein